MKNVNIFISQRMKTLGKIKKEHVWLGCIVIGPILAFGAVYYPGLSVLAAAFILIGLKGILVDIM
jgi:hypothetical protein